MLTFQDVLTRLSDFWLSRGAVLAQPFNTEVGAGTANPATTLRVLGPEPWRVAYVEPSVRPDDSRYGKNPNRLQTHTQFQVILKPDPGNPQELYLESLAALGIDLHAHDIRFVEDNWASPALGAWGLGWEVWLDGLEITQFTYFQQACSMSLEPVSVELTYGIERIVMALQAVEHFKDIAYAPGVAYGEVYGQIEYEMSKYYLEDADVETYQQLYRLYVGEAERLLELRLPVPAYTNVLKCSHIFNVLDSRGVISTAERARAFATMRRLCKVVAELWVEGRAELGYPLGSAPAPEAPAPLAMPPAREVPQTLVFEIGVEELPAAEVPRARDWLLETFHERLQSTRLRFGTVTAQATPRRLVVTATDVEAREDDWTQTVRGPRVSAAFTDSGPTRAAQGFAAKHGVDPAELGRVVVGDEEYVAVVQELGGRPAAEVLSPLLGQLVRELRADRNMRWSDPELTYVRAIRWLLALLGDDHLPVTASLLTAGTTTRGLRHGARPVFEVSSADAYPDALRANSIVLDGGERRRQIEQDAVASAAQRGGRIDPDIDRDVIDEITDLVESPFVVLGDFNEAYLELPSEILLAVMRKHQRYLPVRSTSGSALLPHFITFANGPCDPELVAAGNAAVIRARFEDALFFWNADRGIALADFKAELSNLTFENNLGSMADRSARIDRNARALAELVQLDAADAATVLRAGELAKFDLGSKMVIEMTSLAGTMARYYALAAGEDDAVATALEQMEWPRTAGAEVARTVPGAVLAIADRADLLAALFAVGIRPTGSSDPYGLRRAALGLLATLRSAALFDGLSISRTLTLAAASVESQGVPVETESISVAADFVTRRFAQVLLDEGHDTDLVAAVGAQLDVPRAAENLLAELMTLVEDDAFEAFVELVQRVRRLLGSDKSADGQPDAVGTDQASGAAEMDVTNEVNAALAQARANGYVEGSALGRLVAASEPVVAATSAMLDSVQVLHPDRAVRARRIRVLLDVLQPLPELDWDALARRFKRGA